MGSIAKGALGGKRQKAGIYNKKQPCKAVEYGSRQRPWGGALPGGVYGRPLVAGHPVPDAAAALLQGAPPQRAPALQHDQTLAGDGERRECDDTDASHEVADRGRWLGQRCCGHIPDWTHGASLVRPIIIHKTLFCQSPHT